mgnify:CR=1 FL=1
MNTFANLLEVKELSGRKTRFYTIQFEDKPDTEFEDFLHRHENQEGLKEQLDELLVWLDEIAARRGALHWLFRHENKAHALPPKLRLQHLDVKYLRLYCLRLNDNVVILFNGGVKTTDKAKNCPNVRTDFNQANRLADAIYQILQSGDIGWNYTKTQLVIAPNFELEL